MVAMDCFKLLARMTFTVKQPGKQCSKLSALSWNIGGHVFISFCRTGIASAAIMACDFATSIAIFVHECLSK